jgi:hypothetical protein
MSLSIHSYTTRTSASLVLAIKITPPPIDVATRRKFHLALLLDTSGSMEGERISAVKRTLQLLTDALNSNDQLSIITYDSRATLVADAVVIGDEGRATLHAAAASLRADGGTNLESALTFLRDLNSRTTVDAVFILTDGHINQGLSAVSALTRLVTAAVNPGTPVNTLGYGAEHNARLLRDMALRSRGSYTFADAAEMIPAIIGDIVGGLETEYGRNAQLSIPDGWRCMELVAEAGATEYNIGTLVAEKDQWIVLTGPVGSTTFPEFTIMYDANDGARNVITYNANTDTTTDLCAEEQYCRVRVAAVFSAITEMLESRRTDDANAALRALADELDASPAKDRTFVIGLRAQVDEALETLRNVNRVNPFAATRAGNPLLMSVRSPGAMPPHNPILSSVVSRFHSNTAALGAQRGFFTSLIPTATYDPSMPAAPPAITPDRPLDITHSFSSPSQRTATTRMTERYTQAPVDSQES